ncbi:MAG: GIY-YIG nuclease family protein [Bacteroidota bacterium]|nr:GIY-YIG nuclease family protein [Bacteroidota bacterium]
MHCTYVLYSHLYNKLYVGETSSIIERFRSHNHLATKGFTTRYRPWMVIHIEFFESRPEALQREKQLKSGQGRQWIRDHILPPFL